MKTVGGLAKTKLIGQAKLAGQALMCSATHNLVRMGSIGGWWTRIMRKSRPECAQNGQKGLQQAPTRAAKGRKYGTSGLKTDAGRP